MPHDDPAFPPPPRRRRHAGHSLEIVTAVGVLVISLISLFVAVSANNTQERLLAASVWPYLQFGSGNVDKNGMKAITFDLVNAGTGPARLHWSELRYDNQPIRDLDDLLRRCCDVTRTNALDATSSGVQRRVLATNEWVVAMRVPHEGNPAPLWDTLDRAIPRIRLRACYCSVLDDCWLLDSDQPEPTPITRCPAPPGILWKGVP